MRFERIMLDDDSGYVDAYIADPISNFTRKALLVIPGGGYSQVCSNREGEPIAQAFIPYGYNAFVLHYYTGKEKPFPIQLIQATKAVKLIKDNAEEFGIDSEAIFAVGFSAGGHLAASLGALWKLPELYDAVEMSYGYNKLTGVMLIYPVINNHKGSFKNLLATDEPTAEMIAKVSIDKHIDADSSPAFIMHTANDQVVNINNALDASRAYANAGVPFELHVYPDAPHGVALGNKITKKGVEKFENSAIAEWVKHAAVWADSICENK